MDLQPIYDLKKLKKLIAKEETRHIPRSCIRDAFGLGFSVTEMIEVILLLEDSNFIKQCRKEIV